MGGACQLSADASGRSLHHRFYRERAGKAPLRESLAAGLIEMSGWAGKRPLLDPMCGSGTIPIEAALLSQQKAPALLHGAFGFQRWMGYREKVYESVLASLKESERGGSVEGSHLIFGSDYSGRILDAARDNADRAGTGESIAWTKCRAEEISNPCPDKGPGVVISNPPYGERINEKVELRATFQKIGLRLKEEFQGWECWMLLPDEDFVDAFGLRKGRMLPLKNGPLDVVAVQLYVD